MLLAPSENIQIEMENLITHNDVWNIFDSLIYNLSEKMHDDTYYVIAELVNEGILSLEMEKADHPLDLELAPPKRDTTGHQILKGVGAYLLRKLGDENVSYKYKRCDVYGHDLKIRIECGHTKGIRLLESILNLEDSDNEFWVLQYYRISHFGNSDLFKFKYNPEKSQEYKNHRRNHMRRMTEYYEKHGQYPEFWSPALGVIQHPFKDPEEALREQFQ